MKPFALPLAASLTFLMVACTDPDAAQDAGDDLLARAEAIHDAVITIDSHDDIPFDFATDAVDPLNAARQVNLEKMRAGGLDVGFFHRLRGADGANAGELRTSQSRRDDEVQRHSPNGR